MQPTKREGRVAFLTRAFADPEVIAAHPDVDERRAFVEALWSTRRAPEQRRALTVGVLPHVAARIFGCPVAITHDKAGVILSAIGERFGVAAEHAIVEAAAGPVSRRKADVYVTEDGVAVIPVFGTLVKRASGMDAESGMLSYETLHAQLQGAARNPGVRGILLQIDSPGGEVSGVLDLADSIRAMAKPVWAIADEHAYSAGYWIASAADRLVLPRTGGVGSIGVLAAHVDESQADAAQGRTWTFVTAGEDKAAFNPHGALSDGARARLQAEVDRIYGLFVSSVAAHRGLTADAVIALKAHTYEGDRAVEAGLADGLGTLDSVLAEFTQALNDEERASARTLPGRGTMEGEGKTGAAEPKVVPIEDAHRIREEARAQGKAEATAEAQARIAAITEMCALSGTEARLSEFLASGKSADEIRSQLFAERATRSDATAVRSLVPATAGSEPTVRIDAVGVYAKRAQTRTQVAEAAERRRAVGR